MNSPIPNILKQAQWIWPDSPFWDMHNCYAQFRKSFRLASVPKSAPLYITADQSYQLYVNGQFVCRGPARGYQSCWPFDEVDVRPFLKKGKNVIAVRAHNPGFSNFQYLSQGNAGLLVGAQWGNQKIVTDVSWKTRRQAGVSKDTVPTSVQLFCQEHIDLRIEPQHWTDAAFDDSAWSATASCSAWNAMPWYDLQERQIPLLTEKQIPPQKLIGISHGKCAKDYRSTRDVTLIRSLEGLAHQPPAGGASATALIQPLHVPRTGPRQFRSYLIDFEKTVVGNISLGISGCRGGEIIDALYFETIDRATLTPDLVIPTHCRIAFGGRITCCEGENQHTFFHPFGFRYLVLTIRDTSAPLEIKVNLNWIGYPLEHKGRLDSSDQNLTAIWKICAWTQQCCSLDAYVDTPWREQAQWWGDARVQAWNTFHLNGDARLFRRGIGSIATQTAPNGLTYGHAPTMAHSCILPDFTLIWVLTLWDYYWQTGSLEAFQTHENTLLGALDYFARQTDPETGLVSYDPRYWLFLDWTNIFKDGYPTVLNLWLLITLTKTASMYRLCGNTKKAAELEAWAAKLRAALRLLINKNGLLSDGRTLTGTIVKSTSVHAQTLAIMAELDPKNDPLRMERVIIPSLRGEFKTAAIPSAYWITYIYSVAAQSGYGAEVLASIKQHWTPMIEHGTTWENFQVRAGDESHSHAWSAHPLFHLMQIIGGIRQTAPAWKEIQFAPVFHGTEGGAVVPTPNGPIQSHWQRGEGIITIELTLPKGVAARVELPGRAIQRVTGKKTWKLSE